MLGSTATYFYLLHRHRAPQFLISYGTALNRDGHESDCYELDGHDLDGDESDAYGLMEMLTILVCVNAEISHLRAWVHFVRAGWARRPSERYRTVQNDAGRLRMVQND